MAGRHHRVSEGSDRRPAAAFVIAAVVVLALTGAVIVKVQWSRSDSEVSLACEAPSTFTIAADPAIATAVQKMAASIPASDCTRFDTTPAPSAEVSVKLAQSTGGPDLWIPDSSMWVGKTSRSATAPIEVAAPSLASTPAVVAARDGEALAPMSWLEVLGLPGLRLGDPKVSSIANAPLLAALAETQASAAEANALTAALVPLAQARGGAGGVAPSTDDLLAGIVSDGGVAVVSEQQFAAFTPGGGGPKLVGSVPPTGSFTLDYPLAVTTADPTRRPQATEAARQLAQLLASDAGRSALSESNIRATDGGPLSAGRGVGAVSALKVTDAPKVQKLLQQWSLLSIPSRVLAVVDVSGSMGSLAGDRSLIDLTVAAGQSGIALFPNNAAIGLWAFSVRLGGGTQDYRELLPIRRLDAPVDATTQRDALGAAMGTLPSLVKGGTGLYDTTLAAYRTVKQSYDPGAVNSVWLFTDGSNDDRGSLSLQGLLDALAREQDPAQPVVIVTIGIGDDADADTLAQISRVTGGTSHIARDPADIPKVFVDAVRSRIN